MSNSTPTTENIFERMVEFREEQRQRFAEVREEQKQLREFVESKFAEMAAENKSEFKSISRKLEILNDDILKVRESVRDLESGLIKYNQTLTHPQRNYDNT